MSLGPSARKLVLTTHLIASMGWLGAVLCALALAVAGLASSDAGDARAAYVALDVLVRFALLPLAIASLVTGIVQSLGSAWGLLRHYWVVFKLCINLGASILLLLYLPALGDAAEASRADRLPDDGARLSAVLHSAAALALLVVATVLAVYKPKGLTRYGRRRLTYTP